LETIESSSSFEKGRGREGFKILPISASGDLSFVKWCGREQNVGKQVSGFSLEFILPRKDGNNRGACFFVWLI
jgi:hypothetical protein